MTSAPRSFDFQHIRNCVFADLIHLIDALRFAEFDIATAREEVSDMLTEIVAVRKVKLSVAEQEDLLGDICNVLGLAA